MEYVYQALDHLEMRLLAQHSDCITHRIESMCIAYISFEVDPVSETMKMIPLS